jgi:hypothetical protein
VPQTHAERQAAYRHRQAAVISALRSALADAQVNVTAQADKIARLEREREGLYATIATASAAPGSSTAQTPDCPHPARLVDDQRCGGCGQLVDSW